jgi:NAD(P)-dependent dehydrogenase (short-subunit alcohol dehydrogenase family)
MELLLQGKVALVTGAGSGIGRAVALAYAREGARVIVSDIRSEGGQETAGMIARDFGDAHFVQGDVRSPRDAAQLVAAAVERYGRLDVACNNAGIGGSAAPLHECADEDWREVVDVNLLGVFYGMKHQIRQMLDNGGGTIVNLASMLSQVAAPNASAYVASKHGVLGLTRAAALEYASRGIRVNAVGPGVIETPIMARLNDDVQRKDEVRALHPLGRLGQPHEVARLVLWLSSSQASFVTGSFHAVDGGYLAR